ncbi:Type II secretion system protein H [Pseudomonas sp. 8Z]|uniref:type II secretion system minor pseudopilin GspH n=1 Tax=Pseudomonas sp. 8Z TaxID=2653166 RepID=UPI0012F14E8D|nr:type II secretion system minor pseudopilin GspH [Pseudomonas sp. 8Z]VXC60035.1 Type II secretion system protein H [Pseudomonas sp. 8Z]
MPSFAGGREFGQRGFTLIELLVVLVILGSLIGLAVFSVGIAGPGRELRSEAERLSGLVGVLVDEAVLDNREYGLYFSESGYRVLRYDPRRAQWQALDGQAHELPGWAQIVFEVEGEPLQLPRGDEADELTPQLLILSSGELTPFRLRLAERGRDGVRLQLSSDGFRLPRVEQLDTGRAG